MLPLGHNIMHFKSTITYIIRTISFLVLGLQGTPIQNHMGELWSLLHFLEPGKFPSKDDFLLSFGDLSASAEARAGIHDILRPHMLRRTKEDVMKDLPAKHEVIVPVALAPVQVREGEGGKKG